MYIDIATCANSLELLNHLVSLGLHGYDMGLQFSLISDSGETLKKCKFIFFEIVKIRIERGPQGGVGVISSLRHFFIRGVVKGWGQDYCGKYHEPSLIL